MTRTRRFVWSALLSGGSIFVSMAALLVVGKLITTALPEKLVGFFILLLLWSDFVDILFSLGLPVSAPKLIAASPAAHRAQLARVLLRGQFLLLLLASALVLLLYFWTPLQLLLPLSYESAAFTEYLWILPLLFVPGSARDLAMALLAGLNRYIQRSAAIVVSSLVQVVATAAVVLAGAASVETIALATAIGYMAAAAWLLMSLRLFALRAVDAAPAIGDAPGFRSSVRFSAPLYLNSLLTFVYQRFDTLIIAGSIGFAAAGVYDMAKRIPAVLSRVLGAMLVPYLPHIAEYVAADDALRTRLLLQRALILTGILGYVAMLGAVLVQEPLLRLLFTPEYVVAAPVLGLLLTATGLGVQAGILGQTLIALGKPKWITLINCITAVLSVALNLALLPRMGLMGAGVAAIAASGLSAAMQAWLVHRSGVALPLREYLTLQAVTAIALAAVIAAGESVAVRAGVLVVYPGVLLLFRVVTWKQVRDIAKAVLPERFA